MTALPEILVNNNQQFFTEILIVAFYKGKDCFHTQSNQLSLLTDTDVIAVILIFQVYFI